MGVKILRINDRVPIKIDEITIFVSPLSYRQKIEVQECGYTSTNGGMVKKPAIDLNRMMFLVIKYAVREVEGLENLDGAKYKLTFEDQEKTSLTDECVEDLMNIPMKNKMTLALMQLLHGLPDDGKIRNPEKPTEFVPGIEIILPEKKVKAGK